MGERVFVLSGGVWCGFGVLVLFGLLLVFFMV